MMRTLLASLGVAVIAAGALALACPPKDEAVVAAKTDTSACCEASKTAVAATAPQDGQCASSCSSTKTAVAATVPQDGDCASTCSSTKTGVAATAPQDAPQCCESAKAAVAATAPQDGSQCTSACANGDTAVAAARAEPQIPAGFPMMTIVVGDEYTHCPLEAGELMAKSDAAPVFIVRGVQYDCGGCTKTAEAVAAKTGKSPVYAIGEVSCECPLQAKVMLSLSKVMAAIESAGQADEEIASAR